MIAEAYTEKPHKFSYGEKEDYQRPKVAHYQQGGIEPIDFITSNNLNFNIGNVIKYVTRAGKKQGEDGVKDLNKAVDYIYFEIMRIGYERPKNSN